MSDIFSWCLLLRWNQEALEAEGDANAKNEVTAPSSLPENRRVSTATIDGPSGPHKVATPTKRPKPVKRKSRSIESPLKQQSKARSKKHASPSSQSKQDSEEWLQGMQAWLLHTDDGPKLTCKQFRQTMNSIQALASGQGLPATVYSGGAVFLPHHSIAWETVDLACMKQAVQRFCQQEAVSIKRTCDVFVCPMEHVQLYRDCRAARA